MKLQYIFFLIIFSFTTSCALFSKVPEISSIYGSWEVQHFELNDPSVPFLVRDFIIANGPKGVEISADEITLIMPDKRQTIKYLTKYSGDTIIIYESGNFDSNDKLKILRIDKSTLRLIGNTTEMVVTK